MPDGNPASNAPEGAPRSDAPRVEVFGWTESSIELVRVASVAEAVSLLDKYRFLWIDVEGIASIDAVNALEVPLEIPPLACDTLIEGIRRPGADDFDDVTVNLIDESGPEGNSAKTEDTKL